MARHFNEEMKDICEWNNGKYIIPICVDFDGTLCDHQYPNIGKENEHCFEVMCKWTTQYNVGWILDTMRSGEELSKAIKWCEERGMKFYGIGTNPTQKHGQFHQKLMVCLVLMIET